MTHVVIDLHHTLGHVGQILAVRRTVVAREPGGPCTRPHRVRVDGQVVTVSCARTLPAAQQCPACRVTITVRHTHTDPRTDQKEPAP